MYSSSYLSEQYPASLSYAFSVSRHPDGWLTALSEGLKQVASASSSGPRLSAL